MTDDLEKIKPAGPFIDPTLELISEVLLAAVLTATNENLKLPRSRLSQLIRNARLARPLELCSYHIHLIIL